MSESQCSCIFQDSLNRSKYAHKGLFVKYGVGKSFYVSKIPYVQAKNQIITVSVFLSTLKLTALLLKWHDTLLSRLSWQSPYQTLVEEPSTGSEGSAIQRHLLLVSFRPTACTIGMLVLRLSHKNYHIVSVCVCMCTFVCVSAYLFSTHCRACMCVCMRVQRVFGRVFGRASSYVCLIVCIDVCVYVCRPAMLWK